MRTILVFCAFLFLPLLFLGQENGTVPELLAEARAKLYSEPEQAEKISEYIINQTESDITKANALLLLSKSQYTQGNLNKASKNILEAKELAESTSDYQTKFETLHFTIKLMRELGLGNVAQNLLGTLHSLKDETSDKATLQRMDAAILQDSAVVALQQGAYSKAATLLHQSHDKLTAAKDSLASMENTMLLAQVYEKTLQLAKAKTILQQVLDGMPFQNKGSYQELQILSQLGAISFSEKEYETSLQLYERALKLAESFQNNHYQSKCLEGLSLNYLALEDAQKFYTFKQQAGNFASLAGMDRNQAVNTIFNFITDYGKRRFNLLKENAYTKIYILSGLLILILICGLLANHWYRTRASEYSAFLKYIQPEPQPPPQKPEMDRSEKSTIVPEEIEQSLLHKLDRFESGTKYTSPDMSIAYLASQFDTNTKYLSEVINRQKGKNFNSYVNELRINYIIEKLKTEPVYFNYKVSYLAEESGFSSHSSFATVFKSVTGISPTKFMELLQKRKESA